MREVTRVRHADVYAQPSGMVSVCADWVEREVETPSGVRMEYECHRVDVDPSELNVERVMELFVRDRYSVSEEFALINAYQASVSGIEKDESKEVEYLEFLRWRKDMRSHVKRVVSEFDSRELIIKG